jgi:glycerate kinase
MKVLVAPDKFKGSLTAMAAAKAIAHGWKQNAPDDDVEIAPIADGGEGFAEALVTAMGGTWITLPAHDPIGRPIRARYAWMEHEQLAAIEMSEASGLWRLQRAEYAPLRANTFGTGELIRDAVARGAKTILVGLGGSATTDGGAGMAAALGFRFLATDGDDLEPTPENLLSLIRIDGTAALELPAVIAACDVQNPLLGPRGTAHVFAPQKGADEKAIEHLEYALKSLADVITEQFGCDYRDAPGAGAAGGLGFGLLAFCDAQIRNGFDVVSEAMQLEARIRAADLVITGEGSLDGQTLEGKGPAGVAALARAHHKPVLAFAGLIVDNPAVDALFDAVFRIVDQPATKEDAMRNAAQYLERAARRAARALAVGTNI